MIIIPSNRASPRFLPAPGSSFWAVEWPRIKIWVGQATRFPYLQEWAEGVRVTAWVQPDGTVGIFGASRLDDDFEYQYRFPNIKNHPWVKRVYDVVPPKSAVDAFIVVPGFSRKTAELARATNNFQVWVMGMPYYKGESLMWESPGDGVRIAKSLGFDTLHVRHMKDYPQFRAMSIRERTDALQREAIDCGVDGWMLKADQGGSRMYLVKPVVSVFGIVTDWEYSVGSSRIASIEVSMKAGPHKWKPVLNVTKFPPRMVDLITEMDRLDILQNRRVEIRAESINPDGLLIAPSFHRFAGKVTTEMMEISTFVSKYKATPKESKWKNRRLKDV